MLSTRCAAASASRRVPAALSVRRLAAPPCRAASTVVAIGLGNMGAPLAGRIAAQHPTSAFDMAPGAADSHAAEYGSTALVSIEAVAEAVASANVVVTCLPNTNATIASVNAVRTQLQPGTVWIDATSGKSEDAAALAEELWEQHEVRYLDCAVSGGPKGATNGILAALVRRTNSRCRWLLLLLLLLAAAAAAPRTVLQGGCPTLT